MAAVRAEIAGWWTRSRAGRAERCQRPELAAIGDPALAADIGAGEAKVAELRADLLTLQAGGRPARMCPRSKTAWPRPPRSGTRATGIRFAAAPGEPAGRHRVGRFAAARDKVRQTRAQIEGLNKRRASLVGQTDMAAFSPIDAAETALKLARQRAAQALIRARLIAGSVYELTARPGEYLSLGSLVANIGLAGRLRVRVYADEPELGSSPKASPWPLPGMPFPATPPPRGTGCRAY